MKILYNYLITVTIFTFIFGMSQQCFEIDNEKANGIEIDGANNYDGGINKMSDSSSGEFLSHLAQVKSDIRQKESLSPGKIGSDPACAQGRTYCETADDYPAEQVMRLLKKAPSYARRLYQEESREEVAFNDNGMGDADENPLCLSREKVIYPQQAKDVDNNWMHVVNQDRYRQGVSVEVCANRGACMLPRNLPTGFESECTQKFITRRLVALRPDGGDMVTKSFPLPACCTCRIRTTHMSEKRSVPQN